MHNMYKIAFSHERGEPIAAIDGYKTRTVFGAEERAYMEYERVLCQLEPERIALFKRCNGELVLLDRLTAVN